MIDNTYPESIEESGKFLNQEMVINSYNLAPFPDKYNNHKLDETSFDPYLYGLPKSKKDKDASESEDGKKNKEKKNKAEEDLPKAIEMYFNKNKIANKIVAKWFDRKENGTFSMKLIHERGSYDASEMEAQIAKGSIRGLATLKDQWPC